MTGTFAPHDQQVAVPAPGQLVTVRNRQWVAADVSRGKVASSDPHVLTGQAPHLVTLVSIEDDAWDDELSVIWELEPSRSASSITHCAVGTRWSAWYPSARWPRSTSTSIAAGTWVRTWVATSTSGSTGVLTNATEIREEIEATVVQDARQAAEKAELLRDAEWMTRKLGWPPTPWSAPHSAPRSGTRRGTRTAWLSKTTATSTLITAHSRAWEADTPCTRCGHAGLRYGA